MVGEHKADPKGWVTIRRPIGPTDLSLSLWPSPGSELGNKHQSPEREAASYLDQTTCACSQVSSTQMGSHGSPIRLRPFTSPSPGEATPDRLEPTCSSSSVSFSPISLATRLRLAKEIFPLWLSSKSLKAFRISSLGSVSDFRQTPRAAVVNVHIGVMRGGGGGNSTC